MSEEKGVAFDHDPALQIILAAIQAGAIRFPFSGGLNETSVLAKFREKHKGEKPGDITYDEFIRSAKVSAVAQEVAGLARFDALYILTIYEALTTGLTKKEADRIAAAVLD